MEGSFVLIGNGRLYGGPFPFFKRALIDDGLLDVVVFKRIGYLDIIRYLQEVIFSSSISMPELEYFQTKRLRVSSEEDVPVAVFEGIEEIPVPDVEADRDRDLQQRQGDDADGQEPGDPTLFRDEERACQPLRQAQVNSPRLNYLFLRVPNRNVSEGRVKRLVSLAPHVQERRSEYRYQSNNDPDGIFII